MNISPLWPFVRAEHLPPSPVLGLSAPTARWVRPYSWALLLCVPSRFIQMIHLKALAWCYNTGLKLTGLCVFKFHLQHLLTVWPYTRSLISLRFLICKMGVTTTVCLVRCGGLNEKTYRKHLVCAWCLPRTLIRVSHSYCPLGPILFSPSLLATPLVQALTIPWGTGTIST